MTATRTMKTPQTTLRESIFALVSSSAIKPAERKPTWRIMQELGAADLDALLELTWDLAKEVHMRHRDNDQRMEQPSCPCRVCELVAYVYAQKKELRREMHQDREL